MNLHFWHPKGPLPADEGTAAWLIDAMDHHRLPEFAERHPLTLEHFYVVPSTGYSPFDHAAVQGHLDQVAAVFRGSGKNLVPADFLVPDAMGWTALHYAARDKNLGQVVEALQPSGQPLTTEHFLTKTRAGTTVLELVGEKWDLRRVFSPSWWMGRVAEMEKLWGNVAEIYRSQIDYPALREEAISLSVHAAVRANAADFALARRGTGGNLEPGGAGKERGRG